MFNLKRKDKQWIEVTHAASGDVLKVAIDRIDTLNGKVHLAFDDEPRNFMIVRGEKAHGPRPQIRG